MREQRFRLQAPIMAILSQDDYWVPVTIPNGSIVEVIDGPLDGNKVVDVKWEGKSVTMFAIHLRDHGARIDGGD